MTAASPLQQFIGSNWLPAFENLIVVQDNAAGRSGSVESPQKSYHRVAPTPILTSTSRWDARPTRQSPECSNPPRRPRRRASFSDSSHAGSYSGSTTGPQRPDSRDSTIISTSKCIPRRPMIGHHEASAPATVCAPTA